MLATEPPRVIISNGYGQFHMAPIASDLYTRGMLAALITGGYPRRPMSTKPVWDFYGLRCRYNARRTAVPDGLVWPIWSGEALFQLSQQMGRLGTAEVLQSAVARSSLLRYQRAATHLLRRRRAVSGNIYHYRSGFGGASVHKAKELGMRLLCDHSIVHPALLGHLVENEGRLPDSNDELVTDSFWKVVQRDLSLADLVVVNSDFVRESFVRAGASRDRTRVIYYGVDSAFLEAIRIANAHSTEASSNHQAKDVLRVLAAGTMEQRKGAHVLATALCDVSSARLQIDIAGTWHRSLRGYRQRLERLPRVNLSGKLPRSHLAETMVRADVFVLPTLAEGSARVIFEAMAAGCYIITTPNAGSIVKDGIHGRLVQPGNAAALTAALEEAWRSIDRVREIGRNNAHEVNAEYGPSSCTQRLVQLYQTLLENGR